MQATAPSQPGCRAVRSIVRAAEITAHTEDLYDYDVDGEKGRLIMGQTHGASNFPEYPYDVPVWQPGINNYRVEYTACGEEVDSAYIVPYEVQEAVAQWVAALFFQAKRDPGLLQSSLLTVGSYTTYLNRHGVPEQVKALLAPHRRFRLGINI